MPVPVRRLASGTIWVDVVPRGGVGRVVLYARVSGHDQPSDLDRQAGWATGKGLTVAEVVCEAGSGMNGRRPRVRRILSDPCVRLIVVEYRDRLVRFGAGQLDAALAAAGRRVLAAGPGQTTDDLVRDVIEVLTGRCARRYGRRGARDRALRAVTAARHAGEDAAAA